MIAVAGFLQQLAAVGIRIWGDGIAGTLLINFVIYDVLAASANS